MVSLGVASVDFTDVDAVQQLAGSDEPLVRLSFPDGSHLYSHKVPLALTSGVLSNVLQDTQHQPELCKKQFVIIPLDDADTDAWIAAIGHIHHLDPWEVTFENAQGLLLLAHKYEMPSITAQVRTFLTGCNLDSLVGVYGTNSRLACHLTPETVAGWLTTASRCGLKEQVKICIDYIVEQRLSVDYDLVVSLDKDDANQLLAAKQCQLG